MAVSIELAPGSDREFEIVDGKPVMKEAAGARQGGITARLLAKIGWHVEDNFLGGIYTPDTSFLIGSNERLPDISFVAADHFPEDGEPESLWTFAPDLAVEVVSPNDILEKVTAKINNYFAAGVREVWLVSPEHQTITIYHSPTSTTILTAENELTSEELLPGFRCQIKEIFQPSIRRRQAK